MLTCPRIAEALIDAYGRDEDVKLLIDKSQLKKKYSQLPFVLEEGIPVFIDPAEGLAHSKAVVPDNRGFLQRVSILLVPQIQRMLRIFS